MEDAILQGAEPVLPVRRPETLVASLEHPHQSHGEEIANTVSHGAGLLAAAVGIPYLFSRGLHGSHGVSSAVGAVVFGISVLLVYSASSLYHAWPRGRVKKALRVVEHSAIFFLIAGTYTPFMLSTLRGPLGWTLLVSVWVLAAFGVGLKVLGGLRYPRLSTGLYLGMGWLSVVAIHPLWLHLPHAGFLWLVGGGLSYTLGVGFYLTDHRLRYGHFLWHLFVMGGTACHFLAVLHAL